MRKGFFGAKAHGDLVQTSTPISEEQLTPDEARARAQLLVNAAHEAESEPHFSGHDLLLIAEVLDDHVVSWELARHLIDNLRLIRKPLTPPPTPPMGLREAMDKAARGG